MSLQVYKISRYDHLAEERQFEAVVELLRQRCEEQDDVYILIGNYNIEGVELDALLLGPGGVRILEFKNWGGNITARENGSWTSGNLIIEGGAGKTPYQQIRLNRSRVTVGLHTLLGLESPGVTATIIFGQEAEIDDTQLSDTVRRWLTLCDCRHLEQVLEGMDEKHLDQDFLLDVPRRLRIEEFTADRWTDREAVSDEIYEPEASANFYDELALSVKLAPRYRKVYAAYNQIFQKLLNQNTRQSRITFGGTFAKTDYLLKEHGAGRSLYRQVNDTRVRLRRSRELTDSDLQEFWLYDLRHLCLFVQLIYQSDIPEGLTSQFPSTQAPRHTFQLVGEYVRVIVEQWDEEFIYVRQSEGDQESLTKVCMATADVFNTNDWSYLKKLLYQGAQLNLIRPRESDGCLYPELIIFEPDYLVNISTVAHCFTNYADSPFVDLLKRLEPSTPTKAIVLGNLAGQLLDESIHQLPNTHSYLDSVKTFFRDNAISLLMADVDPEFHQEAQRQKQNIQQAMQIDLPAAIQHFESKEGMVEPSFFSEMLGLQGRMDYLQMDFKVLLEQKSGKGSYPYGNFETPKQTEEHYVQMLLYMALIRYNFQEIYEENNKELHAFLLYSKYTQSLLGLGFSPDLIFRAMKVRNEIVWAELLYAKPDGYRLLEGLTPDSFNQKKVNNSLWLNYQAPQIAEILNPIHQASRLERAYYFRFLTFVANEHIMSKLGNKTKESSGFAATWQDSLSDKLSAGNIYDRLQIDSFRCDPLGRVQTVVLRFAETESNDMSNFRVGDIVILYSYAPDREPNACKTMVFRCSIEDIQTETISLSLRATQSDNRVFERDKDKLWAIEHDFMESSYSSLYRGIHSFLSAPKPRRDLLLLQRRPEVDDSLCIQGDYGRFDALVTRVKQAKDMFLIIGPPGTGKTSYGLLNIVREELMDSDSTLLLMSYTNRAVDEICSKLEGEQIDYIRLGGSLSCAEEYRRHLLGKIANNCKNINELKQVLQHARVIVATTTAMNSNISLFQLKQFSLAVIDEASQILEPHLIGLLSAHNNGNPAIRKFVLIGDHKQLPAVVQQGAEVSQVQDVLLNDIHLTDCRLSLFERLLKQYVHDPSVTYMLKRQGRMHPDIALFPNYAFYNNQLEIVPCPHQEEVLPTQGDGRNGIRDMLQTRRVAFVAVESPSPDVSVSDKVNQIEADIITDIVLQIYEMEQEHFDPLGTVGIIVPYRNQIATIRNTIDRYDIAPLHDITIDTVERYQGSQRKYIIYGFTIQKYYQLNFLTNNVFEDIDGCIVDRKLNVAMTRAKEHLVLVGNPALLCNNFTFYKLIEFIRSRQGLFQVQKDDFLAGRFSVPDYQTDTPCVLPPVGSLSDTFQTAWTQWVETPLQEASGADWPQRVLGFGELELMNAIGYGKVNATQTVPVFYEGELSPEQQALVYAHYLMPPHYVTQRQILEAHRPWLTQKIEDCSGRVQLVDFGCGPAPSGVAWAELFLADVPALVYTGVDISPAMRTLADHLLTTVSDGKLHHQMIDSLSALPESFWQGCSELPSLVVFNFSYFFTNVTAQWSESLAKQLIALMRRHPLNQYLFVIQYAEFDGQLNQYEVFRSLLSPHVHVVAESEVDQTEVYRYEIWTL